MSAGLQRRPVLPAVPRLEARQRAEKKERRRRRLRRAALGALALLPVGVLAWLLLSSPVLSLRTVEVQGNDRLSTGAVVVAADVDLGTSLARVDTSAVQARVAGLAPVAEVQVHRTWPGTLTIRVVERVGVAFVAADAGRSRLVDAEGTPFETVPRAPEDLPRLVVGPPGPAPQDPATTAALQVLTSLPAALVERVGSIGATSPTTVTLTLEGGRTVVWGEAGDDERKAAVVEALLRRKGRTIDVSSPDVAVVR